MGLRSFFKKVGKGIKKALPYVAPLAGFIPGVGTAISGGISAIGGMLGMGGGSSAQNPPTMGPNDGPQLPWETPVQVSASRPPPSPASGPDWLKTIGDVAPAFLSWYGQRQTNSAQVAQAQKQMDFQAEQTGSSYQRAVADMKAAGLNPMLAYSQGGAASGGGAQATLGNEIGAGVSTAFQTAMTKAQLEQLRAQTIQTSAQAKLTSAQTSETNAKTDLTELDQLLRMAQHQHENERIKHTMLAAAEIKLRNYVNEASKYALIDNINSSASLKAAEAEKEAYLARAARYDLSQKSAESGFWSSKYGQNYPYLEKSGQLGNSAASMFHKLKPWSIGAN